MKEIGHRLNSKIKKVHEFQVNNTDIEYVIKKRKNWTAPRFDGTVNFWWRTFASTWKPLSKAMNEWIDDETMIPDWLTIGRTVVLPKTEDIFVRKTIESRPITCLNTPYRSVQVFLEYT